MPVTNFPNGVSSWGVPMLGAGPFIPGGNVLFVQSSHGLASNGNSGEDRDRPLATIQRAIDLARANNGDMIIVGPGHVETVSAAAGLVINKAGVSLIGVGNGSLRPTVNFNTVTTADMDIDAANVFITNFLFTGGIDALAAPLDINAPDCTLWNIETRDVTGQMTIPILTDATCDRFRLYYWRHYGDTAAGTTAAIRLVGGNNIEIEYFYIDGNFGTAAIHGSTTPNLNISIGGRSTGNLIRTRNAADILVSLPATSTGVIDNILGRLQDDAANITEAFVFAAGIFGNNLYLVNGAGERAIQFNGTQSTDA